MAQGLYPVRVLAEQVLIAAGLTDQAGVPLHHGGADQQVPLALLASVASGAAEVGLAQLKIGHHPRPGLEQQTLLFDVRGPLVAKVALQFQTAISYVPDFTSISLTFQQLGLINFILQVSM